MQEKMKYFSDWFNESQKNDLGINTARCQQFHQEMSNLGLTNMQINTIIVPWLREAFNAKVSKHDRTY